MKKYHMKQTSHSRKIGGFICFATPIVADIVSKILRSTGCEVTEKGKGLDTVFSFKHKDKEVQFHLNNLLLEIATVGTVKYPI